MAEYVGYSRLAEESGYYSSPNGAGASGGTNRSGTNRSSAAAASTRTPSPHRLLDRGSQRARSERSQGSGSGSERLKRKMRRSPASQRDQPPDLRTAEELAAAGFSEAQAAGVLMGRRNSPQGQAKVQVDPQLAELQRLGFTPEELKEVGFSPAVLRGAGFSPAELKQAGVLLKGAGFAAKELVAEGYTFKDLKEAGYRPGKLRIELGMTMAQLRDAGFTPSQLRSDGFGPGELKQAGFTLGEIKQAGFQAKQLHTKAGFSLAQLREAGFPAVEVRSIGGVTPDMLTEAGFSKQQVSAAFSKAELSGEKEISGSPPKDVFDLARRAKEQKKLKEQQALSLPSKKKTPLDKLYDANPPPTADGPSGRHYHSTSLLCLRPHMEPRRSAIFMVESPIFEPLIMLVIILNCVTMAWQSPLDAPGTWKADFIAQCETAFLYVYTVEMLLKIVAQGFLFHRRAYLRDYWGMLDFVVVTVGWLPRLTTIRTANLSIIRSLRVLRFLRALKMVPGMPSLVQSLLEVFPKLGSVSVLLLFVFVVFGIVGIELFKGSLHYRCALPGFVENPGHPGELGSQIGRIRQLREEGGGAHVRVSGGSVSVSGSSRQRSLYAGTAIEAQQAEYDTEASCMMELSDRQCDAGSTCAYFDANPSNGVTSFDGVGTTFIVLMQCITFDDWATPMYALMESASPYAWIYFYMIILIGGFFVVNLFLAVIFDEFLARKQEEKANAEMELRAANRRANFANAPAMAALAPAPAAPMVAGSGSPLPVISEDEEAAQGGGGAAAAGGGGDAPTVADEDNVTDEEAKTLLRGIPRSDSPDGNKSPGGSVGGVLRTPKDGVATPKSRNQLLLAAAHSPPLAGYILEKRRLAGVPWSFEGIARSSALSNVSTALVIINMILMCLPYEGMSAGYAKGIETATSYITYAFIIEMVLKMSGLGCGGYWSDGWNVLDGFIVMESIVEILITDVIQVVNEGALPKLSFLRILRMFRILRVLRLMRKWKGLYKIIMSLGKSLPQMANLFVLMMLCLMVFALLGMQLFGGIYKPSTGFSTEPCPGGECADEDLEEKPAYHFDYIGPAMMTTFILMSGEWVDAMEPATYVKGPIVAIYFVAAVVIGRYLVMNLFVGMLVIAFSEEDEEEGAPAAAPTPARPRLGEQHQQQQHLKLMKQAMLDAKGTAPSVWPQDYSCLVFSHENGLRRICKALYAHPWFDNIVVVVIIVSSICLGLDSPRNDPDSPLVEVLGQLDEAFLIFFVMEMLIKVIALGFAFGPHAYLKDAWHQLDFSIVLISLSSLLAEAFPQLKPLKSLRVLRALRPLRLVSRIGGMKVIVESLFKALPDVTNAFFVVLAIQSVFAILGMQLFMGSMASCSDPLVLTKAECGGGGGDEAPALLPPAGDDSRRALAERINSSSSSSSSRAGGLALVGSSSMSASGLPLSPTPLSPSALPLRDVDEEEEDEDHDEEGDEEQQQWQRRQRLLRGTSQSGRVLKGGGGGDGDSGEVVRWSNPRYGSFDNFPEAMRLLYIMASEDEWETPMFQTMAAVGPGLAPVRNDYSPAAIFSLLWMFIGAYFALNLFVGVIVDSFDRIKRETESSATMTVEQQQWVDAMKAMVDQKPGKGVKPPTNPITKLMFGVVSSPAFDGFITAVILANIGVMACDYWGIEHDKDVDNAYHMAMHVFINIYYCECVLKICALGLRGYFGDPWCRFDFFLVCTAFADDFIVSDLSSKLPIPPYLLRVMRVLRILRILRLLKGAKDLRNLIVTMILSFPSLVNVGSLLAIVTYIYAVLGLHLFAFLEHQEMINHERNFESLSNAGMLLFQCLTGDAWSSIMADAMLDEGSGLCSSEEGNCGSSLAIPYFITFQVVGCFVFLNLVVAVILENFSSLGNLNPDLVTASDVEAFKEVWAEFDPDADNYMACADLPKLLLAVPPPMGLKGYGDHNDAIKLCTKLPMAQYDGKVAFQEVLRTLTRASFQKKSEMSEDELTKVSAGIPSPEPPKPPPLTTSLPDLKKGMSNAESFAVDLPTVRRVFAMQVIERYTTGWKERHDQAELANASAPYASLSSNRPASQRGGASSSNGSPPGMPLSNRPPIDSQRQYGGVGVAPSVAGWTTSGNVGDGSVVGGRAAPKAALRGPSAPPRASPPRSDRGGGKGVSPTKKRNGPTSGR